MTAMATSKTSGYASTPLGRMLVVIGDGTLVGLYFDGHERTPCVRDHAAGKSQLLITVRHQLDEYFHRARTHFDLPLRLEGTPFQIAVWSALLDIPYGRTAAYGLLAGRIGRPRSARAVGAANGRNPISIVVPCHRLIGADGGLTGYGWGLERKRSLLELEGADHSKCEPPGGARPRQAGDSGRVTVSRSADRPWIVLPLVSGLTTGSWTPLVALPSQLPKKSLSTSSWRCTAASFQPWP